MNRKKRQILTVCKQGRTTLLLGIFFILLFAIIYISLAIKTKETYFYSFFFTNIRDNIILMILASLHVGILATGILLLIIAFFKKSPLIKVYSDRFELSSFLSHKKIIFFKDVKRIKEEFIILQQVDLFGYSLKKINFIFFENPTYSFYLSYLTTEYFDDVKVIRKNKETFFDRNCKVEKHTIKNILKIIKKGTSNLNIPFIS